ncbi:MAG: arsenate reductase ArsC [Sulfurospirillaceae bacterium]|jgi:arsenate reductase|nr:arsenate reductase ArsC [Sulfurospirillaceae bacterium]MCK9546381.1 arsenate reductase ArsC [Sulfurospirillaceae bacterium]MDY0237295.1 arsenate reductase ArsC [Campylobacterales bacterium]NLM99336.1 hypothetical protein [Campylobacteraceae bacterium]
MKRLLLLSSGNPCRAVVAEALCKKYLNDKDGLSIVGAGENRSEKVSESALRMLEDEGIDSSQLEPRTLNDVEDDSFDLIITLCDHFKENCPIFPDATKTVHMDFPILTEEEGSCEVLFNKIKEKLIPFLNKELA